VTTFVSFPFEGVPTEYRERFLSPRRDDYKPHTVLPKIDSTRPPSSRSFLSFDKNSNQVLSSSEYRVGFTNHYPKRPYVFHARPSHVFDYVPLPISTKPVSRLSASTASLKDTEYQERFPNYSSFIPTRELLPDHISTQPNIPSGMQNKRDRMGRSQYFQQLVSDDDKLHGGQRHVGASEQRTAFQWPYQIPNYQKYHEFPSSSSSSAAAAAAEAAEAAKTTTAQVYPPYYVPRNIYEPLPTVQRMSVNTFN
jgi:hypothetical protein